MKKIILRDRRPISPFNEPARDLRILNKPLWLYQRDLLSPYCTSEIEVDNLEAATDLGEGEALVYRDSLFFDEFLLGEFISAARRRGGPARIAFSPNDQAIVNHALPLQEGIFRAGDVYLSDLWYFPNGVVKDAPPLVIDTQAHEIGYYHVPSYMADKYGDLVYYVPHRAFLSVENWVHVFMANSPFGILAIGSRFEKAADKLSFKLKVGLRVLREWKHPLSCSALVKVGRNTQIDPYAIIEGPTIIGNNCVIGPGAVISNCIIGNNVNIAQGCQLLLSVVSDGCFLPFRAALFMTTLMENAMVAQNACLQLCVVGRNSFIGAGNTFTDFNLLPGRQIRVWHRGRLEPVNLPVLGGCVGHDCRIGANFVFWPGRTVESGTILINDSDESIRHSVYYAESHHHRFPTTP